MSEPPESISARPREAPAGGDGTSQTDSAARAAAHAHPRARTHAHTRARRGRLGTTPAVGLGTTLAVAAGAVALRVVGGAGFANYDTLYALVWGRELARGGTPQYGIPLAPTPHPLVEALGFVLSPLTPHAIETVTVALGFLALSACAWAVYRLGTLWFNRPAGALAAVVLITRVPILSYGVRAYVDVPYLLLVLGALIVETGRRRAGAPVLVLLALAGLLRPEAWVFSGLYWVYLALPGRLPGSAAARATVGEGEGERRGARTPRQLAWLALLAATAPVIWVASDWLITGDALWSLTNTRHTALTLGRETGIAKVPEYIPRRVGEILGPAVLAGAALGGVLALLWLPSRARLGAAAGLAAVLVFAAFAAAGLPIDTRYAFLIAAILCVFYGAALCGWTLLARGDRRRRWWMAGAALLLVALLATGPAQYRVDHSELNALARQQRIQGDLVALVDDGTIAARCEPIGVPNHAPIPLLALWLQGEPGEIVSAQQRTISRGTYVEPADAEVQEDYILDRTERAHPVGVPPGFAAVGGNRSWRIFERCP